MCFYSIIKMRFKIDSSMKKISSILVLLVLLVGAGLFFRADLESTYHRLAEKFQEMKELTLDSVSLESESEEKEVNAPPPLRAKEDSAISNLTKAGVIKETNKERLKNNRRTLSENKKLSEAAQAKLKDMFQKQYFDHISPSGKGPADLAKDANYAYLMVGENLALGNFENDAALVQAWMESPGHRENILNAGYTEIGVAVGKGIFEGQNVWLAVQEFGRPESACPKADVKIKKQIEENLEKIEKLQSDLEPLKQEAKKPASMDEAEKNIQEYNELVRQYNALVKETKNLISRYNQQVRDYNACVSQ